MRINKTYAESLRGPAPIRGTDKTGSRMGKLTVLYASTDRTSGGAVRWVCQCDCGNLALVVLTGKTNSCGCIKNAEKAVLTPQQREAVQADTRKYREIAADYGCSVPTIWRTKQ